MRKLIIIIVISCISVSNALFCQLNSLEDVETLSKKGGLKNSLATFFKDFTDFGEPFQLGGGIGINMRSYSAFGGDARQDPFFYSVNANLSVRIYQIELPFSMVMTAKNKDYAYPNFRDIKDNFNQRIDEKRNTFMRLGASPYYKWAKLHLGHRAMSFSNYTLNNLNFFGAGMELTPDKFRIGAMVGRLAKAEPIDLSLTTPNLPIYQRIGWGTKVGYGDDLGSIDIILFGAKDDENSIMIPTNYPNQVSPEQNLAIGIQAQKLFFNVLRINLEYTNSAMSPNANDGAIESKRITNFLMPTRNTTYFSNAFEGSVGYEGKALNAGVAVTRIDPDYKTLGAYFFNQDIMNLEGYTDFTLFDGHLNTQLRGGIQSNNLDNSKPTTTKRLIYDISTSWAVEKYQIAANYSNNSTQVGYVLNPQLDSLNAVIITSDAGLNFNYTLPPLGKYTHSLALSGNIQSVSDDIEKPSRMLTTQMYVGNVGYILTSPANWKYALRANYNQNMVFQEEITRIGFGLGVKKSLMKDKITFGIDGSCFLNSNTMDVKSRNILGQLMMGYQIAKGLGLQVQWGLLQTTGEQMKTFTESTGNVGLQYQFNYTPKQSSKTKQ